MNRKQRRVAAKQEKGFAQQGVEPSIPALFDEALKHHQAGRLADAEQLYKNILCIDPKHAGSLHLLGVIMALVGQGNVALELIRQAIAVNDRVPFYHNNIGKILKDLNHFDEAKAHLEKAVTLAPDYADAHNNLGTVFYAQRRYDEARKHFERTLALQPNYPDAHNNLGGIFYVQGRIDEALDNYERALTLKPENSDTYFNIALTRFQKTPLQQWRDLCLELLGWEFLSDVHKFDVYVRLALYYWAAGDWAGMTQAMQQALSFPWATVKLRDKRLFNTQAYLNILLRLSEYYETAPRLQASAKHKAAIIGDSHCVAYTNTLLELDGVPHKIEPHLVMGCKAWHLAQKSPNVYAWSFDNILDGIPSRTKCLLSIGEIDCRHNEGIMAHYAKCGSGLDVIIETTVGQYVNNAVGAMSRRDLDTAFINVPAPYIDEIYRRDLGLTDESSKTLIHVIRSFNKCLDKEAAKHGRRVIDLYRLTADPNGVAHGEHNLDGYHLKPYALAMAAGSHA